MLNQLTLEDLNRKYPTFADKVLVVRTQHQCSACHVYVKEEVFQCPHCGVSFLSL